MRKRSLRNLLTLSILPFLFSIVFLCNSSEAANGRVITIDGIDFGATFTGSIFGDSGTGYIYSAIDPASTRGREITDKIGPIQPFYWASDAIYTDAAVHSLTGILRDAYTQTKASNAPLVIVSHSWGTVLAYIVLKKNPDIVVDKLITMGSPLKANGADEGLLIGSFTDAKLFEQGINSIDALPNVKLWYNYWTDCDVVSASIPAVGGLNIDTNYFPAGFDPIDLLNPLFRVDILKLCHSSYYSTSTWGEILTRVLDTLPPLAISYSPNPFAKPSDVISAPADVIFDAIGSLASNGSATYSWDFGDGSQPSSNKYVVHHYNQPNNYNVIMTMTDASGPHVVTETVIVRPPQINVEIPDGFDSLNRKFSTLENSFATEYTWNFGDGSATVTGRSPDKHHFPESRIFNVSVTLSIDGASPVSYTEPVFVGPGTRYIQGHTIYGNETWYSGGTYVVQGSITVAKGATLTIEPGVTVKMAAATLFSVSGTLKATGVTFTWADGQSQWYGMDFIGAAASGSHLENCVLEHANGKSGYSDLGIIYLNGTSPTIAGTTIRNSDASYGIYIDSGSPVIINSTVSGMTSYGIFASSQASPTVTGSTFSGNQYGAYVNYSANNPIFSNNTFTNNSFADIYATGTITGNVTWDSNGQDGTYRIWRLTINEGASLTIATGRTVKVDGGGLISVSGTLKAMGVTFTWADGQSQWYGMDFIGAGASGSHLENCVLEHANGKSGYSDPGIIYLNGTSPTITGTTIRNSDASYGIYINGGSPVISNSTVSAMSSYGVYVINQSSPTITGSTMSGSPYGIMVDSGSSGSYTGNTFSGNQYGAYVTYSDNNPVFSNNTYTNNSFADLSVYGTITGNVTWDGTGQDGVYQVQGLIIANGASLIMPTGRTVKLTSNARISVNGTLKATGVKFTWADGQSPWSGISFSGAGASNSRLENCEFEHTIGYYYAYNAVLDITGSSPTIIGCTLHNSTATYGIYVRGSASPQISNSTISGMTSFGINVVNQSSPTITGSTMSGSPYGIAVDSSSSGSYTENTFSGNSAYGLYYSGTTSLTATNNNWGDPTGPLDDTDDRATGGLFNPTGKGNRVSDHVNYFPWTGATIGQTSTPTNLAATPANGALKLTWKAPTDCNPDGYKIYYGTVAGNYGTPIVVGAVLSYQLTGLANGTPYYIAITSMNSIGAESAKSAEISVVPAYVATLSETVTGSGSINSDAGLSCTSDTCSGQIPINTVVTLTATPADSSLFDGWSGACVNKSGDCKLTMSIDTSVTATFTPIKPLRILADVMTPANYYDTFLDAFDAMADNSAVTIHGRAVTITEDLNFDKKAAVRFIGGFNGSYSSNDGWTVLRGALKIRNGSLKVQRLVVQ
ncbi:MAG: right-handed parallel beta-helix repeat-containing protein [Desulfuromonadales bacterium]|nr:right-handed parallel beta-helix repeat-containing protein [Desulfuromonadales bacterium]